MEFLFSPNGRIGRLQWWLGGLVALAIMAGNLIFVGGAIIGTVDATTPSGQMEQLIALLPFLIPLFTLSIWIHFCLTAKRYHDRNKSGWWFLICLVPTIGPLWQLVECGFFPGTPGRQSIW